MVKISVVIPVYNTEKYLPNCLDHILNSTFKDIEVICVNDGSTDRSLEVIKHYAKRKKNLKYLDLEENQGPSIARNIGILQAKGEYISFVDSDDLVEKDFFEKLYTKAIQTNADIVKGNYRYTDNGYMNCSLNDNIKNHKTCFSFDFCSAIYKTDLIIKNNLKFPEQYSDMEDPCFAFLSSLCANNIEIEKDAIINIVKRQGSLTFGEQTKEKLEKKFQGLKNLINIINENSNQMTSESYGFDTAFWMINCFNYYFQTDNMDLKKFIISKTVEAYQLLDIKYKESYDSELRKKDEKWVSMLSENNTRAILYNFENHAEVIPIFLSSDENYAPLIATTIASICYNTDSFICFYILDGGITNFSKRQIRKLEDQFDNFSIEFIEIDIEKEFSSIDYRNACTHVSISTYNRFLIPKLKPEIKKAIYLDVDLIVLDDIKRLYEIDLEDYALAACPENLPLIFLQKYKLQLKLDNDHSYFNAGILLLNCETWRKANILQQSLKIEQEHRNNLIHADQDVLNLCFNNNYKKLDVAFNLMTNDNSSSLPIKDLVIRHFNCAEKPWHSYLREGKPIRNFEEFWFFASLTPFYEGLKMKFLCNLANSKQHTTNNFENRELQEQQKQVILNVLRTRVKKDLKNEK